MRTTLNIDERLMRSVRKRAADTGRTMTQIIEEALRDSFTRAKEERASYQLRWRTVRGRVLPGVDLSDRESLFERMEGRE